MDTLRTPVRAPGPGSAAHRTPFERIALLLQGGGALGAYQGGVYQALAEANLHPDWVAGVSIGSVNAALIAGNPPQERVGKLRAFWQSVSENPLDPLGMAPDVLTRDPAVLRLVDQTRAFLVTLFGAPHFFYPRLPPPAVVAPGDLDRLSFYDTSPLRATLERLVDFDRINAGDMRFSVGAVNVRTGMLTYFDNTAHRIGPAHVMASGSLPPSLPATEVDGEYYWDGGVVSNTPLQWVLNSAPRADTLAFQIDLWSAAGDLPRDFCAVDAREKDIRYSSRTKSMMDHYKKTQKLRIASAELLKTLPDNLRNSPQAKILAGQADEKVCNIVHLIYRSKKYEGVSKDFEFSRQTMETHWRAGYEDAVRSLDHREILQLPEREDGVRSFDLSREHEGAASRA